MPIRVKKKRYKLTTAGRLVFSSIALLCIALTLYNTKQIKTIRADLQTTRSEIASTASDLNKSKLELEAIHEHLASMQFSQYQVMDGPFIEYEEFQACDTTSTFKSWMDYRMITDQSSKQYKLQQESETDPNGHRTTLNRLHIAISGFEIGDELNISLSSGTIVNTIVSDVKASTDCTHADGSLIEFVIDKDLLRSDIKRSGNFNDVYEGTITLIERVGNYYE